MNNLVLALVFRVGMLNENLISVLEMKSGSTSSVNEIIFVKELHKNYQMSDKNNSHIILTLSVYKSFH